MSEDKNKNCQRCGNQREVIVIKENDFMQSKTFGTEIKAFLNKTNYDFLCKNCVLELDELLEQAAQYPFPDNKNQVIEGVHYYKEKALWVFTELYQMQRGFCCKNGCRHCAYGFKLER